jgi:hypothetical protein
LPVEKQYSYAPNKTPWETLRKAFERRHIEENLGAEMEALQPSGSYLEQFKEDLDRIERELTKTGTWLEQSTLLPEEYRDNSIKAVEGLRRSLVSHEERTLNRANFLKRGQLKKRYQIAARDTEILRSLEAFRNADLIITTEISSTYLPDPAKVLAYRKTLSGS